jgi:hypothetical protein
MPHTGACRLTVREYDDSTEVPELISEMNVVPYVDVMLVLLVIFMIAAPLMTIGRDSATPIFVRGDEGMRRTDKSCAVSRCCAGPVSNKPCSSSRRRNSRAPHAERANQR